MPEGTPLAFGVVKFLDFVPFDVRILLYDHLANPLAVVDNIIVLPEINKYYAYLSPIVCIDSSGSVGNRQSVIQSEP